MNVESVITKKQKKVFEDIAGTAISQTLKSLSKITQQEWHISSKKIEFYDLDTVWKLFPLDNVMKFAGELVFKGEMPMLFLCVFPQKSVINLTHQINVQAGAQNEKQANVDKMTIAEVSNILSNSFLGVIANILKTTMLITAPSVSVGSRGYLLKKSISKAGLKEGYVLASRLLMQSDRLEMTYLFAVVLSKESFGNLVDKITSSVAASTKDS